MKLNGIEINNAEDITKNAKAICETSQKLDPENGRRANITIIELQRAIDFAKANDTEVISLKITPGSMICSMEVSLTARPVEEMEWHDITNWESF